MQLTIHFFARARDLAGGSPVTVDLPEPATVRDLRQALSRSLPALAPLVPHLLVAVDQAYAREETPLTPAAEIACFPPVSGG